MTLLDECKALADDWDDGDATWRRAAASLRAIIARHEPGEWRGPGDGGISHIGECKGEWTCDCGLRMTEAEIVARLTSRPLPDDKLREALEDAYSIMGSILLAREDDLGWGYVERAAMVGREHITAALRKKGEKHV